MITVNVPCKEEDILKLNVGEGVLLNGTVFTARDKAHQFLLENDFEKIKDGAVYHCGPIVKDNKVVAAGPTTSYRMDAYTPKLIEKYGIKAIIGKGGMDKEVVEALKGKGVYFSAVGGAAVKYAKAMKVKKVYKQEFGMAEAIWEMEVKDFPVIVAIDSNGNSIYNDILGRSKKELELLFDK